jgi:hypothetical protein
MLTDFHVGLPINLELKLILNARRNGTFGVDNEFLRNCFLLCDDASSLRKLLEIHLNHLADGRHTPKDSKKDTRYLADLILVEGLIDHLFNRGKILTPIISRSGKQKG